MNHSKEERARARSSSTKSNKAVEKAEAAGFRDWLADHSQITSRQPPGPKTKAYAARAGEFSARLAEGYTLDDLKLATRGAWSDEWRRENGYVSAESVLRPSKVHDLIENGRLEQRKATSRDELERRRHAKLLAK